MPVAGRMSFVPKVRSKSVRNPATRHAAHNRRVAESHKMICEDCREDFTASDVRQRLCGKCRARGFRFVAVDGEGMERECRYEDCACVLYVEGAIKDVCVCGHSKVSITKDLTSGHVHTYVLLGVGDKQISDPDGLDWETCFEFLYSQYDPKSTYVGFYLTYDFTMTTKSLPWNKAKQLWEKAEIEKRKKPNPKVGVPIKFPVKIVGRNLAKDVNLPVVQKSIRDGVISGDSRMVWEVHLHADKRLEIRPMVCECPGDSHRAVDDRKYGHPTADNMYINDVGDFFQSSFLTVINPKNWATPIVTQAEFDLIEKGKANRANAILDAEMASYNAKENELLARIMTNYAAGLRDVGINLSKRNWYGPGQAAQAWLKLKNAPEREDDLMPVVPAEFFAMATRSYFGGWFEIMAHGHIPGNTWEYDINSAYPSIISRLPCVIHGKYSKVQKPKTPRQGLPALKEGSIRLVKASVWGSDPHIGPMLHRNVKGFVLRPASTYGTFWQHELEASIRAGLIDRVECYEWMTYDKTCACEPPLAEVANLYQKRLEVGKKTPTGQALKLVYNSMYGKFAQSVGDPPYANPVYASLITAGCRVMILDAIATHPQRSKAVVMIATDGVYFTSPHPGLPVSNKLGEWEMKERSNLTLFKPGVYWDDDARNDIKDGTAPRFKARGVSARDFVKVIGALDEEFSSWGDALPVKESKWPARTFTLGFSMVTPKQALARGSAGLKGENPSDERIEKARDRWDYAGLVSDVKVTHTAWPGSKRSTVNVNGVPHRAVSMLEVGTTDGRLYRSKPNDYGLDGNGLPIASMPYNKTFGVTAQSERGMLDLDGDGITPDGSVADLFNDVLQVR